MGDFGVDVTGLRALSGRLRAGVDELGAVLAELSGATSGQLGSDSLDGACQEFQQAWQHGMSLIRANVTRVAAGLDATAAAYQRHEHDLATLLAGIPSAGGGDVGGHG